MGIWSYDFVEVQTHDGPLAPAHDVEARHYRAFQRVPWAFSLSTALPGCGRIRTSPWFLPRVIAMIERQREMYVA
jgi:hypothetical protein